MAIEIEIIRVLAKKNPQNEQKKSEINDNHVDGEEENDDGEVADEMEW